MLLPQIIGGILQERPEVPKFTPVSAQEEQLRAIRGNIAALPELTNLAQQMFGFEQKVGEQKQSQILSMFERALPGYGQMLQKQMQTTGSMLKGQIPKDVSEMVARSAAVRALSGGYGGAGMHRNLLARDLGLTSLGLMQQGEGSLARWTDLGRRYLMPEQPQVFDLSRMFVSTPMQIDLATSERDKRFQRDWTTNQLKAEYSLGTTVGRAMIKTDDQIMGIISSLAGSAGGMMGGGGFG